MHLLEYGQGSGERTHPVNQKQNIQSGAHYFSSGAQVSLSIASQYTNYYETGITIIISKLYLILQRRIRAIVGKKLEKVTR